MNCPPAYSALPLLLLLLGLAVDLIHAQEGFINIDCGKPSNFTYKDNITGLNYTSDSKYINDVGEIHNVSSQYQNSTAYSHSDDLRSFPKGKRNCYTLKPFVKGQQYMVRGFFLYGNYDGLNRLPQFDLHLDVNYWDTIEINDSSTYHHSEIFAIASSKTMSLCLINTDSGIPFVSAIDVRPLRQHTMYDGINASKSLVTLQRLDFGASYTTQLRYKKDTIDRLWSPYNKPEWTKISTSSDISRTEKYYSLPQDVMATAVTPTTGSNLNFSLTTRKMVPPPQYYFAFHFAELQSLTKNQSRIMTIYLNDDVWSYNFTIKGGNFKAYTFYTSRPKTQTKLDFSIRKEENSTLPPLINAMQVLMVRPLTVIATNSEDGDAIAKIKEIYGLRRNWEGDPCAPKDFAWEGLTCRYSNPTARIISLSLASSGLEGEIPSILEKLLELERLDLSNNSLTGEIPEFLGSLPKLTYLNLRRNRFEGPVPKLLKERAASGKLILSVDDTNTVRYSLVVVVVASICSAALVAIITGLFTYVITKRKRDAAILGGHNGYATNKIIELSSPFKSENRKFTYHELESITGNFKHLLGKGGFGCVFYGILNDDEPVAVKMLSQLSLEGQKQLQAEANLLTRIHHKNVVSLIGYCNDKEHMGLVYEYMAQGSLEDHLAGEKGKVNVLSWRERLRISVEAAQGLRYLHEGCTPAIVHRDMKSSNILLNEKLEVKIGDFGMSRIFESNAFSRVLTNVVGTPGYVDPEYFECSKMNEKSDVYSFGVVLLELITGLPAIITNMDQRINLVQWVKPKIYSGQLNDVVDARLQDYDPNLVWKIIEVAMACTHSTSAKRPSMLQVSVMLKDCLELENTIVGRNGVDAAYEASSNFVLESFFKLTKLLSDPGAR